MDRPPAPAIPLQGDERTLLLAFLDFYRAALVDRAFGLSHEQLQVAHPPATLTLSRLLGHMAFVEQFWFRERFDGLELGEPWASLDWETDRDAEMALAQVWPVEQLLATFNDSVADSRARVEAAVSLDQLSAKSADDGQQWNLRWILIHMIEEYARHCGHADLIREAIDGDSLAPD
ncbi:MAG: DinB family protein [Acidimicrobiales bacterium]